MSTLLVFDFDGTIADTKKPFLDTALEYSVANDLPQPDLAKLAKGYGLATKEACDFGWGCSDAQQFVHLEAIFELINEKGLVQDFLPPLFNHAVQVVTELGKDFSMAIVTSRLEASTHHILTHYGLRSYFKTMRTYDDIQRRNHRLKPYPDKLLCVLDELSHQADRTIMIGDTTMDIEMAKAASCKSIGVTWGFHSAEDLKNAGADKLADNDFLDLQKKIMSLV